MKIYNLMLIIGCLTKVAEAAHIRCGLIDWRYQPTSFVVADQEQAYQVQLQNLKCYDQQTGEVELVYSSQLLDRISQQDYHQAQQRYRLLGGQMGLQGDIIHESFYQPVVIHNHQQSSRAIQLRIKVCMSRDAMPTLSSTFINVQQLLGITIKQPFTININNIR